MEQPASPEEHPDCCSFWRTIEWRIMKQVCGLAEISFMQGDWGGIARKPTTVATTLDLELPDPRRRGGTARKQGPEVDSKALARWAPGMMRSVAKSLVREVQDRTVMISKLSWEEHLKNGHVPFRRDCGICQRASARARPHRRVDFPESFVLSLDTAGPFKEGKDVDNQKKKYLLVGAYTWPVLKESPEDLHDPNSLLFEGDVAVDAHMGDEDFEYAPSLAGDDPGEDDGEGDEDHEVPDHFVDEMLKESPEMEVMDIQPVIKDKLELPEAAIQEEQPKPPDDPGPPLPEEEGFMKRGDYKTRTIMQCIPMKSKGAHDVLVAVQELFLRFQRYGYPIYRIHTDSGKEFSNKRFRDWCMNRGLVYTKSCPDERQQNGRAEASISSIKNRVRRLLHSARLDASFWPVASRHVIELERRRLEKDTTKLPRFGQRVVCRRRMWGNGLDFAPTSEEATYLTPVHDVPHGHLVMRDTGRLKVVSCVWSNLREEEDHDKWVGNEVKEEDRDPYETRRRIRGKTSMAGLRGEDQRDVEQVRISRVLYEAEGFIRTDAPQNLGAVAEGMKAVTLEQASLAERPEEDEVLQTRIGPNHEVFAKADEWEEAIKKEINSLDGTAVRRLYKKDADEMIEDFRGRVEIVPGKAIFSRKAPDGRRKCRIVVCGNFVSNDGTITNSAEVQEKKKKKEPDLYAGGADAIALRSALSIASRHRWQAASLDVKTAFLNADFNEGAKPKDHEEERLVMMQPPRIMVKMGFCAEGELWVIDRAMYGLRESPRSWSSHRDTAMMTFEDSFFMRLEAADEEQRTKKRKVVRCVTEENLWQIVEVHDLDTVHESQVLLGLVLVYVDDFLIMGSKDSIRWFDKKLREKWEATALEWANPREALRFLGMDIYRNDDGTFHANQRSYIKELGKRYGMENREARRSRSRM